MSILNKFLRPVNPFQKISYAQSGEDLIIEYIFMVLGMSQVTYLDIGTHHPVKLSNTYLFYKNGQQGVCVEPNPLLFHRIEKKRPRDICLNVGVSDLGHDALEFYIMSSDTLSTFSKQDAERYSNYPNQKIERTLHIPVVGINDLMQYFDPFPNFVSLDTEGFELRILQGLDYARFRPQVFCVETLTYTGNKTEEKLGSIISWMERQGYFVYADTYINSIFVDQQAWAGRP
jgi:FkbM family methyltransferase